MSKKTIRLTESDLHRIVSESVKRIIRESTEDDIRRQQMDDDWSNIERYREYLNRSHPSDSKFAQSTLDDAFASSWADAGKTPGALAMDAQLPYEHPYTTQKGRMYKRADTSQWSDPGMKGRGYEGPNAARNFARNIHYASDLPGGMTPYPRTDGDGIHYGNPYADVDWNNIDDQDYFEDKIKSTDGRWYQDEKDKYKSMKKASQLAGGKRSKKDDDKAFKRALKAADSRPLNRKGSLNRAFD